MSPKDTIVTAFDGKSFSVELFDTTRARMSDTGGMIESLTFDDRARN